MTRVKTNNTFGILWYTKGNSIFGIPSLCCAFDLAGEPPRTCRPWLFSIQTILFPLTVSLGEALGRTTFYWPETEQVLEKGKY